MTSPGGGNVVGSAYVEIRPKTDRFEQDADRQLDGPAERLSARLGTKVGAALGKGVGLAFRDPKVTAGIGASLLLATKLGDEHAEAQGRLAAAFDSTGQSLDAYKTQIDALVDKNHELAISESTTKSRLAELTLALGDPAKALKELATAQDLAAGTGRSFRTAVDLVKRMNEGDAKAYELVGVKVKDLAKAKKELQSAESDSVKTTDSVSRAQQSFNDKLAVYQQSTSQTLTQQQALYRAYETLRRAQADHAAAQERVAAAQREVRSATYSQAKGLQEVTDKYKGQDQAASGFYGNLRKYTVEARDDIGSFAAKYGDAIGGVAIALQGIAGTTKIVRDAFSRMRDVEVTASTEAATAVQTNSLRASTAMVAEADVAVVSGSRIRTAFAGAARGVGLLSVALANVKADLDSKMQDLLNTNDRVRERLGLPANAPLDNAADNAGAIALARNLRDSDSDNPLVATRAQGGKTGNIATSGAKVGQAAAKATVDGFSDFLKKYGLGDPINAALAAAHDKAVAAAQKLVDDVQSRLDTARGKLQSDYQAMRQMQLQIAQTVTQGSTLADAFNGGVGSARNPFGDRPVGGAGGLKAVESFLHGRAVQIARFARALNQLRKKGLDERLVREIAQLGTDEGLQVAQTILAGTSADIRTLNLEEQQIARAANVVGRGAAGGQFGSVIAADRANTQALLHKLDEVKAQLARISGNVNVRVAQTGASAAEVGREVGSAIRQGMKGM